MTQRDLYLLLPDYDLEADVQEHVARVFASARSFGAEVEPDDADRAQARAFGLVSLVPTGQHTEYRVHVDAPDAVLSAYDAALEAVE